MNSVPKILHIIDSLGLGGAQTVVKGIFEYQQNNKNIFLFALRNRGILMEVKHQNVQISNSSKKYSLKPIFVLRDLIRCEEITILHCHLFRSQVFGFLLKKIYFPNIKLIFHEHGRVFTNNFIYNCFLKLVKGKVNIFLAVSKATKEKLIKFGKIDKNIIKVLYNFVDLKKFNRRNIAWNIKEEKEKLSIKESEFVIGFVGRLAKIKGCEYLIKALPNLAFPYKVLIAGDGPEKEYLKNLAEENKVSDKIIFLGYREDAVFIYSLLDVMIIPSLSEANPMVVYESQAMGVPEITSNIESILELIENRKNGIFFELKNPNDLSEKIKLLYANGEIRNKLIKNGVESVKKYDLENYMINLNRIYENFK